MSGPVEDQAEVLAFLGSPSTHGGQAVDRIDTHAAVVFLAGARAYKLKRAVRFDYLDFSTADLRHDACEAECRVNRRTAPHLYRGVRPITRDPTGGLALDGEGSAVDWVLEMVRFPQEAVFDRLAADGRLDLALMSPLATAIAAFHRDAEPRSDHGGDRGMTWVVDGNLSGLEEFGAGALDEAERRALATATRAALAEARPTLEARRLAGDVRHCHGDLHLRNIVLLDGHPVLFDGIEFNDEIACIDVLYDLAFLLMDLEHRALAPHANAVLNAYLTASGRVDGLSLLPLLLACRATVRAKTSVTAARLQDDDQQRTSLEGMAREYLRLARQALAPPAPCLVAIGGLSGTGKSTVARALAPRLGPAPGAVVLRSDVIRKQRLGVAFGERLGPDGYAPTVTEGVYRDLADRAAHVIAERHAVIVDAVHQREADRDRVAAIAAAAGVPFVGLWLEAPASVLMQRVRARATDASDADAAVVEAQVAADRGGGAWLRVDASATPAEVLARAEAILTAAGCGRR